ncbi:hypothetical protein SOD_c30980 [Serratia plymuthica 4Rx13]|nr:hypothetical protein SOD_c30980 [Serratia plymuthica 4Rx13]
MGKNRFSRGITGKFGREGYAFEVFIAELGSAFPVADLGIVGEGQHESDIASWLKAFKERQRLYFQRRQRGVKSASLFDG